MNTLICAGGSAQRVLTAVLQFCAAGLGPEEIRILVVDPDGSNGNGADCRQLVELYMQCRKRFAGNLGTGSIFSIRSSICWTMHRFPQVSKSGHPSSRRTRSAA
jgi:hypothetical protein